MWGENHDRAHGRGWLFCGRAAERMQSGTLAFFDRIVANNLASFLAIMAGKSGSRYSRRRRGTSTRKRIVAQWRRASG
jgi:hypothetical protein